MNKQQHLAQDKIKPVVTVVIPTYNRASLLVKAIGSVLSQTWPHLELIIADDGSTDHTKEMVMAIRDARIKWLGMPHSGHIGKVRNAGAAAGTGTWIAFLDSDDYWVPDKLERQLKTARETGCRWCYGGFELVDETGKTIPPKAGRYKPLSGDITRSLLTHEATAIICTLLVERNMFQQLEGFSTDERLRYRGDYEFVLRLSRKAEAVALPQCLARVLEHPGRVTHSIGYGYEKSVAPYDIFLEQEPDPALRKIAIEQRAWLLSEAAVRRAARSDYTTAFRQLGWSMGTDRWGHWVSACYRSFKTVLKKKKPVPKP